MIRLLFWFSKILKECGNLVVEGVQTGSPLIWCLDQLCMFLQYKKGKEEEDWLSCAWNKITDSKWFSVTSVCMEVF